MDPDKPAICIADVVAATAGREANELFYVIGTDGVYVLLADGKGRKLEKPKRKKCKHVSFVLRSETRVGQALRSGDKLLNSELRRDLAYLRRELSCQNQGGV